MLDLLIRGGKIVDGTGAPAFTADIGVRDGRIVAIGSLEEPTHRTIDAAGLIVAPGFVDIHTHYDAQVFWDPYLSPSTLHGVTTVVGGNCGFTIAPLKPSYADYAMTMMSRVEGISLAALKAGLNWDWSSFGEWLGRLDGKVALNVGFLVGHSALRLRTMDMDAVGKTATEEQLADMRDRLRQACAEGALGLSSSVAETHNGADGRPVPSRWGSREELMTLAGTLSECPGTLLELIPPRPGRDSFTEDETELLVCLSNTANRSLNWNAIQVRSKDSHYEGELQPSVEAAQRGARVVALTLPTPPEMRRLHLSFLTGFILDAVTGWADFFALPPAERLKALADPETRRRLAGSAQTGAQVVRDWDRITILETFAEANAGLTGLSLGQVAAQRGQDIFDVMFDIVVADGLRTDLLGPAPADDDETWKKRIELWRNPHTIWGASDAGAHGDIQNRAGYAAAFIGMAVRDKKLLPLEETIHNLTDAPARFYGISGRGRIAWGWWADLVVFDLDRIDTGPEKKVTDQPGGAWRFYREPRGVEHVVVNGVPIVEGGEYTGNMPGKVLRSGIDTETITVR